MSPKFSIAVVNPNPITNPNFIPALTLTWYVQLVMYVVYTFSCTLNSYWGKN